MKWMEWFMVFLKLNVHYCIVFSSCKEIPCNHEGKIAFNKNPDSDIAILYQINQS